MEVEGREGVRGRGVAGVEEEGRIRIQRGGVGEVEGKEERCGWRRRGRAVFESGGQGRARRGRRGGRETGTDEEEGTGQMKV